MRAEDNIVGYYESIKRELKRRPIYECRCDERLKTKSEGSPQIETRLIDEKFSSVMGECVIVKL